MEAFVEVIRMNFKLYIQYKWTFAMSLLSQPIIVLVNYMVFHSIYTYGGKETVYGYSMEQMVWFFTANLLVNSFVWNPMVGSMSSRILSGELTMNLLRPMSVFRYDMADCAASRLVAVFMDFLPGMVIYSLILPPRFLTLASLCRFLIVTLPAFLLNYLTGSLIGLAAMWVKNSTSLNAISNILISFVGGSLIPMEFYPECFRRFTDFLPYKYIYYWPIQFFLNKNPTGEMLFLCSILVVQTAWIVVLLLVYRMAWKRLLKRYGAVGG